MANFKLIEQILSRALPIINLIGFIIAQVFSYLSTTRIFAGNTTGEIGAPYKSKFEPAGFAFAIWGLIAVLQGMFIFLQLYYVISRRTSKLFVRKIGILYFFTTMFFSIWLVFWGFSLLVIALITIILYLILLLVIYVLIDVRYGTWPGVFTVIKRAIVKKGDTEDLASEDTSETLSEYSTGWKIFYNIQRIAEILVTRVCFSVYVGWLCVATIANASITLKSLNVNLGWTETGWTCLMICIVTFLGILFLITRQDFFVCFVYIWAFVAISVKQKADETVYTCALVCAGILLVLNIITMVICTVALILWLIRLRKGETQIE